MNVTVIGTGYVGLVAGACFAHAGRQVTCVDIDAAKIAELEAGGIPIYEPGLEEIVKGSVAKGRLTFTTDTAAAARSADIIFIAVGTPPSEDGSADLSHVMAVARGLAPHLEGYTVVVCKSTVPIGTCDKVAEILGQDVPETATWDVVMNPEFLKEGAALDDFFHPDRVVVGTTSEQARAMMGELYLPFVKDPEQIHFMAVRSAEMTKYAANCMLATRISFMNEIANLCELVGVDVADVKRGIGSDTRIGPAFLNAGIGYGGSCFPKDVKALLRAGQAAGASMSLLQVVEDVNARQKRVLAERLIGRLGDDLRGRRIALLGLAFKPETDDMREAPSIEIVRLLLAHGAEVIGYDPVAHETADVVFKGSIAYAGSWREAVQGVDAVLLVTEWMSLRVITPKQMAEATDCRLIFDGRNAWDPARWAAAGFEYRGMGRPARRRDITPV